MDSTGKSNMISFQAFRSGGQFQLHKDTLGMDLLAKAAVHVPARVQEAKVNRDDWLAKQKESSGWTCEPLQLLQAIAAYEKCYNVAMDVITT